MRLLHSASVAEMHNKLADAGTHKSAKTQRPAAYACSINIAFYMKTGTDVAILSFDLLTPK